MNKQLFYRNKYKNLNPKWIDSSVIYHDQISQYIKNDTKILDVGCGHSSLLADIYAKTPFTYGVDPNSDAVDRNTCINHIEKCFAEEMPFEGNYFDVVVCAWVLEHLENPQATFREIYRVLKPKGKLIFLTPNALNYNVWLIRLVPEKFHEFFTQRLYGRQENDTFSKRYRINSPHKIQNLLSALGFRQRELITNGDPSYLSFNQITFILSVILEKLLDTKLLHRCKVHIIGIYEK